MGLGSDARHFEFQLLVGCSILQFPNLVKIDHQDCSDYMQLCVCEVCVKNGGMLCQEET